MVIELLTIKNQSLYKKFAMLLLDITRTDFQIVILGYRRTICEYPFALFNLFYGHDYSKADRPKGWRISILWWSKEKFKDSF